MLGVILVAVTVAAGAVPRLAEASHAIEAGRLTQARSMIAAAVADGAAGREVDRVLADLAHAGGNHPEALARYRVLLTTAPADDHLLERAAWSAVAIGQLSEAEGFAERAVVASPSSWRAWNIKGVIADRHGRWAEADEAYALALLHGPGRTEILNNQGWSRLLQGDWEAALRLIEQAVASSPRSSRAINNLELARAGLAGELPKRQPGESGEAWAARLNDAGVAARLRGDRVRAVAAFARAIEAHGSWYGRAANNLEAVGAQQ